MKGIFKIIININILETDYSDTYFKTVAKEENVVRLPIRKCLIDTAYYFLSSVILDILFLFRNKSIGDKNLFFYDSYNQYESLKGIKDGLDNSVFLGLSKRSENRLYSSFGCILSFLLFPLFFYKYLELSKKDKRTILENFPNYFYIYGMFLWWKIFLKFIKTKSVFMSNDHLVFHRVLRMAAQANGIPTIYIQHACVTEKFPKLEFDFSLLEGRDSFEKYSQKNRDSKIELIGMPKFDRYFKYVNKKDKVSTIGICTSRIDSEFDIENICKSLCSFFGSRISLSLRSHPRDFRHSFYEKISKHYKIKLSHSKKEDSFEFLSKMDMIIAGDSSINLEAVLMNVYPIYYCTEKMDYYGFIKNNLITDIFKKTEIDNLCKRIDELIMHKPYIRSRAKYYVATVGTKNDGKSTKFVIKLLKDKVLK